jgi:hypothetical protein
VTHHLLLPRFSPDGVAAGIGCVGEAAPLRNQTFVVAFQFKIHFPTIGDQCQYKAFSPWYTSPFHLSKVHPLCRNCLLVAVPFLNTP